MLTTTQALVLREVQYKESDKILTVLTREAGKVTVKARGCRRKGSRMAAACQLLAYSEMTLFEYRDHYTLNEADPWSSSGGCGPMWRSWLWAPTLPRYWRTWRGREWPILPFCPSSSTHSTPWTS